VNCVGRCLPAKAHTRSNFEGLGLGWIPIAGNSYPSDPATARSDGSVCPLAMCVPLLSRACRHYNLAQVQRFVSLGDGDLARVIGQRMALPRL
jgi:hypothetical protein